MAALLCIHELQHAVQHLIVTWWDLAALPSCCLYEGVCGVMSEDESEPHLLSGSGDLLSGSGDAYFNLQACHLA